MFNDNNNNPKLQKKGFIHKEKFLDIIDIEMKMNSKFFKALYYEEALEKDGEWIDLTKLREAW